VGLAGRSPARHRPRPVAGRVLRARSLTLAVATVLLAVAVAPTAEASFDPPDDAVINANLPASIPLSYRIDLDTLCGVGASATVGAWVRDPSGAERRVNQDGGYGSAFEASFGVEVSVPGAYARWLDVACAGKVQRVEEGAFSVVADSSLARQAQRCARAKRAARKARKRYGVARKALRREAAAPRRRAVRRTRAKLRDAKDRRRVACAPG
jgi:hypothetical protein